MLGDALAHQFHGVDTGALQITHAVVADVTGKAFDLVTDATNQLAAVASAGAQPMRLASINTTDSPRCASSIAVLTPVKPPPITQTSALRSASSAGQGVLARAEAA